MDLAEWFWKAFTPGWGHVIEVNGTKTFRNRRPTAELLGQHLGLGGSDPTYLAIRPSPTTRWVALDIDRGRSPYHPALGPDAMKPVLDRCALIGLRQPLTFRSSHSDGIHLWFPLSRPVKSFDAALSLRLAFEAGEIDAGDLGESFDFKGEKPLKITSGMLETFPNVKQKESNYNAIRFPFTGQGNGLWVEGFGLVEEPSMLPDQWVTAAAQNDFIQSLRIAKREPGSAGPYNLLDPETGETIPINWVKPTPRTASTRQVVSADRGEDLMGSPKELEGSPTSLEEAHGLLARGWTGSGQTHNLSLAALMVAGSRSNDPTEVATDVRDHLIHAPGFEAFSGDVKEIRSGQFPGRAACRKAARFTPAYKGSWKEKANQSRAAAAEERALEALEGARRDGVLFQSLNQAITALKADHGAPSKKWWFEGRNARFLEALRGLVAVSG